MRSKRMHIAKIAQIQTHKKTRWSRLCFHLLCNMLLCLRVMFFYCVPIVPTCTLTPNTRQRWQTVRWVHRKKTRVANAADNIHFASWVLLQKAHYGHCCGLFHIYIYISAQHQFVHCCIRMWFNKMWFDMVLQAQVFRQKTRYFCISIYSMCDMKLNYWINIQ